MDLAGGRENKAGVLLGVSSTQKPAMSSRMRRLFICLGILFVFGLGVVDRQAGKGLREAIFTAKPEGADAEKYHLKSFKVKEIVDGDTVDIWVADGQEDFTRVRLLGVDTPETKDPRYPVMYYGPEAAEFARQLLADKEVTVMIDTVGDVRGRYGRLLAYIEVEGVVLNEELIRKGFGYADLRFKHSKYKKYVELMETAVRGRVGVWERVEKKQLPKWLQREEPSILAMRKK